MPCHPPFSPRSRLAVLVAVAIGGWFWPWAQTSASEFDFGEPESAVFQEVIDVRVIHVEALVSQRGEPVTGLGVDDFELKVDGETVPIEYFTEVREGLARAADDAASGRRAASVPALPSGRPAPTSYLVFVDDDFTIESRRDRVLRGLADQLSELGPEDRMAVVGWDGRRLELLSVWTGSQTRLRKALSRAQGRPAYGLHRRSEWRRLADELSHRGRSREGRSFSGIGFAGARRRDAGVGDPSLGERDVIGSEVGGKVARVARAAASALRGLGGVDGRKVMLMISGGMPSVANAGIAGGSGLDGLEDSARIESVRRLYRPVIDAANRLGFTLYPIDAGDRLGASLIGADTATLTDALARREANHRGRWLSEDVFYHLAEATGGEVVTASAASDALAQVRRDTRSYYWLGFTPSWRFDDDSHEVEVTVRGGGEVRSRRNFADLSATTRANLAVESAHLFDVPVPGSARLDVTLGTPSPVGFGRLRVGLDVRVPLADLTFLEAADGTSVAGLELRIAATDDRGAATAMPVLPIEVRRDDSGATHGRFETEIELRRRPHRLLVAVRDPISGEVFARRLELRP